MGDYLRRAYDEAERVASRGNSDATRTRQDAADEVEEAIKAACDRILPAHYMTEETYQYLRQRVAELRAENDRLRKMVAEMYPHAKEWLQLCVTLGAIDDKSYDWQRQMSKLGIEVNQ